MTRAAGSNAVLTVKQEQVWGTPYADDAVIRIVGLKNESLKSSKNNFESDMINAYRCTIGLGDGNKAVEGNIVSDLIPEGLELFFLHLLGNPKTGGLNPTLVTSGSAPNYTHVLKGSPGFFQGLTIQKEFPDIDKFLIYKGCRVNSMAISLVQEGLHEITFGFIGKEEAIADADGMGTGTPAASTISGFTGYQCVISTTMKTTDGTIDTSGTLDDDGDANYHPLGFVTAGNINIANNIETDGYVLGSAFRASAQYGKRACSGDFTVFFENDYLYKLYSAGTICGVKFMFNNGLGQKLSFKFPSCKLSGTAPEIASFQGLNLPLTFNAKYDETALTDVIVTIVNTLASIEAGTEV